MSGDGSTLVGCDHYSDNEGRANPYTWKEGVGKTILERLNKGPIGIAYGTNYDGSVVVGYCSDHENDNTYRATVWINGVIKSLGLLPPQEIEKSRTHICYSDSLAFATNFDGSVTVGWCHDKKQKFYTAFVHSPEMGMESLGASQDGKFGSAARAINWNGNVIVGKSNINGNDRMATVWIRELETRKIKRICLEDYLRPYLPAGITLDKALSVSADGSVIVGSGILKTGMHCVWRAYLPEFKSGDIKFGAGEIVSDKLSMKPTPAEAN